MPALPVSRFTAPFDPSAAVIAAELARLRAAVVEVHDHTRNVEPADSRRGQRSVGALKHKAAAARLSEVRP